MSSIDELAKKTKSPAVVWTTETLKYFVDKMWELVDENGSLKQDGTPFSKRCEEWATSINGTFKPTIPFTADAVKNKKDYLQRKFFKKKHLENITGSGTGLSQTTASHQDANKKALKSLEELLGLPGDYITMLDGILTSSVATGKYSQSVTEEEMGLDYQLLAESSVGSASSTPSSNQSLVINIKQDPVSVVKKAIKRKQEVSSANDLFFCCKSEGN